METDNQREREAKCMTGGGMKIIRNREEKKIRSRGKKR